MKQAAAASASMTLATLRWLGLVTTVVFSGCTCDDPAAAGKAASSAKVEAAASATKVMVDDGPAILLNTATLTKRSSLETLLGEGAPARAEWRELVARSGPRNVTLQPLQRAYAKHELSLYRDAEGRLCFGAFRPIEADMPGWMKQKLAEPSLSLVGVETIELRTKERAETAPDASITIAIEGGAPVVLDGERLRTLKLTKPFRGSEGAPKKKGWLLRDVLSLAMDPAQVDKLTEVVVHAGASKRAFTGKEVRGDDVIPVIKQNRRGTLKLFVYKGEGDAEELSGVTRIEVTQKPVALAP